MTGSVDSVKKALNLVAQQLLDNPPRERDSFPPTSSSGPSPYSFATNPRPEGLPPQNYDFSLQGPPFLNRHHETTDFHPGIHPPFPKFNEGGPPVQPQFSPEPITYKLLCANEKVGSVIGKGGNIVKTLQNETGCEIKAVETTPDSEYRIIMISGLEVSSVVPTF